MNRIELQPETIEACVAWIKEHRSYSYNGESDCREFMPNLIDKNFIKVVASFPRPVLGRWVRCGLIKLYYLDTSVLRLILTKEKEIYPIHGYTFTSDYNKNDFTPRTHNRFPELDSGCFYVLGHKD